MTAGSDRGYAGQERRYLAGIESRAVVDKVRDLVHEGNVRRLVVKDPNGRTAIDVPVNAGVAVGVAAPIVSAVGVLVALARGWTIRIERREDEKEVQS
jgi:hypothetical protein